MCLRLVFTLTCKALGQSAGVKAHRCMVAEAGVLPCHRA